MQAEDFERAILEAKLAAVEFLKTDQGKAKILQELANKAQASSLRRNSMVGIALSKLKFGNRKKRKSDSDVLDKDAFRREEEQYLKRVEEEAREKWKNKHGVQ